MASNSGHLQDSVEEPHSYMEDGKHEDSKNDDSAIEHLSFVEEEDKDSNLFWWKRMQWLEAEIDQHTTQLAMLKSTHNTSVFKGEEESADRAEELEQTLIQLSTDRNIQKLMLNSVRLGHSLIEILWKSESDAKLQTEFVELVEHTTACVSNVLRIHKDIQTQQSTLTNLEDESVVLSQENRKLMFELQKLQHRMSSDGTQKADDDKMKRQKTENESLTAKIDLLQFCLQGLIFGSGLNWAEDKALCDLVLSLGQSTDDLLKDSAPVS